MAGYKKYLISIIIILVTITAGFKVLAVTDNPNPPIDLPDFAYGHCKYYAPYQVSHEAWGNFESKKDCFTRDCPDWVAFCPQINYPVDLDPENCNCQTGVQIVFSNMAKTVSSKSFIQSMTDENCTFRSTRPADLQAEAQKKQTSFGMWGIASDDGRAYSTLESMKGCIGGCGILGKNCLNFFANNKPKFRNNGRDIYEYDHPLFPQLNPNVKVKGTAAFINEMMKRNNQILAELGVPGKCSESNLRELLGWPEGCGITDDDGGTYRRNCNDSNHCEGIALDLNCKENSADYPNGCGPRTQQVYEIMQRYWGGNNIIVECTEKQIDCSGKTGGSQIIHIDLDPYEGAYYGSNQDQAGCMDERIPSDPWANIPQYPDPFDDILDNAVIRGATES